jgi:hypothetical protein
VQHAVFVGVRETVANRGDDPSGVYAREPAAVGDVVERFARDILHDNVKHPVDFTEVIDTDEVRMI